jgi:hypothetical protein
MMIIIIIIRYTSILILRRNFLPPPLLLFFEPEDESNRFIRNVDKYLPDCTVLDNETDSSWIVGLENSVLSLIFTRKREERMGKWGKNVMLMKL